MSEWAAQKQLYYQLGHRWIMPNFTPKTWWECDIFSVNDNGMMYEHEIKLSVQDFRADFKKTRERWKGGGYVSWIEIVKRAPRLHKEPVSDETIRRLGLAAHYRYLKIKFQDIQVNIDI